MVNVTSFSLLTVIINLFIFFTILESHGKAIMDLLMFSTGENVNTKVYLL